jgi:hypothetical protein
MNRPRVQVSLSQGDNTCLLWQGWKLLQSLWAQVIRVVQKADILKCIHRLTISTQGTVSHSNQTAHSVYGLALLVYHTPNHVQASTTLHT